MELLHDPEFWVAVGFVMVLALLWWKGVPVMVGKMLDQRSAAIAAELDEAKRLSAEAAALLTDYKKRAAGAEAEAAAILKEAQCLGATHSGLTQIDRKPEPRSGSHTHAKPRHRAKAPR